MSDSRIQQFKQMAEADPNNELGHFSLGKAYLEAGEAGPAIGSFRRVIELNPNISKVYDLLASALLKDNQRDAAIEALTTGVRIAAARGDVMPKNDMIRQLKELGAPIPAEADAAPTRPVGAGEVHCQRCGNINKALERAPMPGDLGKRIVEQICANCWREWIGNGTKLINELRLPMSDPQAQKVFVQHMREFLNI